MNVDIKTAAAEAEKVVEAIVRIEPIVSTMASFVPGAAPIMAVVHPAVVMLAPFIEKALIQLAAGNNGDAFNALIQLIQHVTAGQPNSAILAATPSSTVTGEPDASANTVG